MHRNETVSDTLKMNVAQDVHLKSHKTFFTEIKEKRYVDERRQDKNYKIIYE